MIKPIYNVFKRLNISTPLSVSRWWFTISQRRCWCFAWNIQDRHPSIRINPLTIMRPRAPTTARSLKLYVHFQLPQIMRTHA